MSRRIKGVKKEMVRRMPEGSKSMDLEQAAAFEQDQARPTHYVGIGASAGGLEAIEHFFQLMPEETGLAFIIIQHLSPDYKSMMVELLSKKTRMEVKRAIDGMRVEANIVYLIPPKKNLTIFHGKLLLSDQPPHERWINLPIDIFFRSLAEDQGERAIGIILSGTGSDGSRGVRAIKEYGGMIMVQHEKDAKFDGMPKSASSTGTADFILRVEEMPDKLLAYVKYPYLTKADRIDKLVQSDDALTTIFAMLRSKTKVDFTHYKPSTVLRRIERRMNVNQVDDLQAYIRCLKSSNRELIILYHELLIGVTNFFRDREAFELLGELVLPQLIKAKNDGVLRVWVAGCSTGEEAYSLAILFQEVLEKMAISRKVKIFATDVDNEAIMTASSGIYPESIAADLGPELLRKYFQRKGENYCVTRNIREMVVFAQHNLIHDPPFTNIDLVSCRNLLIYLQPVLQQKAMTLFNFSLNSGGILFLGNSETTGDMSGYFTSRHNRWKIYESKGKQGPLADKQERTMTFVPRVVQGYHRQDGLSPERRGTLNDKMLDRLLQALEREVLPLTIVVNEDMEVVYTIGDTADYIKLPSGMMANDIRKMLQKDIAVPLTIGIQKCFKEERRVTYNNIRFSGEEISRQVNVIIIPIGGSKVQTPLAAVLFVPAHDNQLLQEKLDSTNYDYDKEVEQRILDLEQELQYTKENLQATIEELETSNEELQATNEELLASNEELQSTNEELQSVNEELYTVNSEHQRKIMELTELNNDIDNLLESTEIGTIFLDEKLMIRKFTPEIQKLFNLISSDIGRPFGHLTHNLKNLDILAVVKEVIASSRPQDHHVQAMDGKWYLLRVLPYNIAPHTFAGAVLTMIEVSDLIRIELALENSEARLGLAEKVADFASWQWNTETGYLDFNDSFERLLGREIHSLKHTYETFLECVAVEDRARVLEKVTAAVEQGRDFEVVHRIMLPDGGHRLLRQVGVATVGSGGKAVRMTGITLDISQEADAGDGVKVDLENRRLAGNLEDGLVVIDDQGIMISVNTAVEDLFGYGIEELVGKDVSMLMPEQHNSRHADYIRRYLESGEAKVIGIGRRVAGRRKNGKTVDVHLSIGEIRIGTRSLFTGIMKKIDSPVSAAGPAIG